MTFGDLDKDSWGTLDPAAARRVAGRVAAATGTELVELTPHDYRGRETRLALFRRDGLVFSLVPGGEVRLGYEGARFAPTGEQQASYAESAEEYQLPDIQAYVEAMTTPVRVVTVPPLLVATEAQEAGLLPVPADHPTIREMIPPGHGGPSVIESHRRARARLGADGAVEAAWLIDVPTFGQAVSELTGRRQRLLSPDEWEYACSAGAGTLWRWGDDHPADGYPYDHPAGPQAEPNLFGLTIAHDTYANERTGIADEVRGGDGGGTTCGGAGFFLAWLTLASAYRDADHGSWVAAGSPAFRLRPAIEVR